MLKVTFGMLSAETLTDIMEDGVNCPIDNCGNGYEYWFEITEDGVSLKDCLGRSVPVGHEAIRSMYKALRIVKGYSKVLAEAQEIGLDLAHEDTIYQT